MKGTRFLEVLNALKPEDMKSLEDFVNSPFFNRNKRIIAAFKYIKSAGNQVLKCEFAKAAFGNEEFTDANFRMLVSEFTNLLEQFIIHRFSDECSHKAEFIKYSAINQLSKSFEKHYSELHKKLMDKPAKSTKDYFILYSIESLKMDDSYVNRIGEVADLMYLSMKLDGIISLLSDNEPYSDSSGLIEKGYLKIGINKREHVFVYTKLLVFSLLSAKNDTSAELETLASKYSDDVEYYGYVVDILLWYYRKNEDHINEFRLIKDLDKKDLIRRIDPKFFLLMIDAGLAVNELTSVLELYQKYKDSVNANDSLLGKAYIEVYRRNYDNALEAIALIDLKLPYYYEQTMNMKLLIFKERDELELYRYAKDALSHWKKRRIKK